MKTNNKVEGLHSRANHLKKILFYFDDRALKPVPFSIVCKNKMASLIQWVN